MFDKKSFFLGVALVAILGADHSRTLVTPKVVSTSVDEWVPQALVLDLINEQLEVKILGHIKGVAVGTSQSAVAINVLSPIDGETRASFVHSFGTNEECLKTWSQVVTETSSSVCVNIEEALKCL